MTKTNANNLPLETSIRFRFDTWQFDGSLHIPHALQAPHPVSLSHTSGVHSVSADTARTASPRSRRAALSLSPSKVSMLEIVVPVPSGINQRFCYFLAIPVPGVELSLAALVIGDFLLVALIILSLLLLLCLAALLLYILLLLLLRCVYNLWGDFEL